VLEADALVAEVPADLVDALEAADDQPLEVELDGDAEVERAVELVVMGRERARLAAAVDRLQHRRLHLDEPPGVEPAAHRGHGAGAQHGVGAALLVHDQVEVAPAEAHLRVGQSVPLLGQRPHALGEQLPAAHAQRQLAAAAAEDLAVDPDQVADVELAEGVVAVRRVDCRLQLQAAAAVDQVGEHRLAVAPARDQPARQPRPLAGFGPGLERAEALAHRGDLGPVGEPARVGVDALLAQRLHLRQAVGADALLGPT
jgi:hypothetical protein